MAYIHCGSSFKHFHTVYHCFLLLFVQPPDLATVLHAVKAEVEKRVVLRGTIVYRMALMTCNSESTSPSHDRKEESLNVMMGGSVETSTW